MSWPKRAVLRRYGPLFAPLLVGVAAGIAVQYWWESNPVYFIQFRTDLGSFLFLLGIVASAALLAGHFFRQNLLAQQAQVSEKVIQEASLSRRRFLARLDHELKNPLTALRAVLAYALDSNQNQASAQVQEDMLAQVDRLGRLVSDLRKLAQLEDQAIDCQPVAMDEVLGEVVEAAQGHPGYPDRRIRLNLIQSPWTLPAITGDRGLLWLACFNLVDNALKFTAPGAEIEVRAFEAAPWLVVEVADTGAGIPAEDLPHLFEELYRGRNAPGISGSGMGLALVRAVIERHGGQVYVRSRPEVGSVFSLHLPLTP